jgi:hypothetical protein
MSCPEISICLFQDMTSNGTPVVVRSGESPVDGRREVVNVFLIQLKNEERDIMKNSERVLNGLSEKI